MWDALGVIGLLGFVVMFVWAVVSLFKRNGKAKKLFTGSLALFIVMIIGAGNTGSTKQPLSGPQSTPASVAVTPTPAATVVPTIIPAATATPEPTPAATATPVPTATPSPTPEPTPEPVKAAPAPTPEPVKAAPKPTSAPTPKPATPKPTAKPKAEPKQSSVYFKNCSEAKAAGAAPIYEGEPGYSSKLDRDGDGVACER
ncbi:excalibur calcium-binding domain-containing protein [Paenibacillus sp. 1P03SA]|uniref:excalibur calcium-binding domain-containing protein n=1 Tax=Paenibacillus sp. 1P03SA TaxID=3132294 RepID=UPI00399FCB36